MKRALSALLIAACVSGLAACGGDEEAGGQAAADGKHTTMKVGVLPIVDVAPLYVGLDKGYFAEEGIDIEPVVMKDIAATTAAVVSGEQQIGLSATVPLIQAGSKKVPVRAVANAGSQRADMNALVVKPDSPIKSAKDLSGKTVAVAALGASQHLATLDALEQEGIDPKSVKFVAVPFPQMPQALAQGRVDAATIVEPFYSALKSQSAVRTVLDPQLISFGKGATVSAWFTSSSYLKKNADAVERFRRAMQKANSYAEEHPDEVRATIPKFTQIKAAAAKNMTLPEYSPELKEQSFADAAGLMHKFGMLEKSFDVATLLADPGSSS